MQLKTKMYRKYDLIEQLIEMQTKKHFLEQKIIEYQKRIVVLDDFIFYIKEEIKEENNI